MELKWIDVNGMKNEDAPDGMVLVKFIDAFFGGWITDYAIGHFDNPDDYVDPDDGEGWKLWYTENKVMVLAYAELPKINEEKENKWFGLKQKDMLDKYDNLLPEYEVKLGNLGLKNG